MAKPSPISTTMGIFDSLRTTTNIISIPITTTTLMVYSSIAL
jgi:hypothetical protein